MGQVIHPFVQRKISRGDSLYANASFLMVRQFNALGNDIFLLVSFEYHTHVQCIKRIPQVDSCFNGIRINVCHSMIHIIQIRRNNPVGMRQLQSRVQEISCRREYFCIQHAPVTPKLVLPVQKHRLAISRQLVAKILVNDFPVLGNGKYHFQFTCPDTYFSCCSRICLCRNNDGQQQKSYHDISSHGNHCFRFANVLWLKKMGMRANRSRYTNSLSRHCPLHKLPWLLHECFPQQRPNGLFQ